MASGVAWPFCKMGGGQQAIHWVNILLYNLYITLRFGFDMFFDVEDIRTNMNKPWAKAFGDVKDLFEVLGRSLFSFKTDLGKTSTGRKESKHLGWPLEPTWIREGISPHDH